MRYLKAERFTWTNDDGEEKPFTIELDGAKHDGTVAEVLVTIARVYSPQAGKQLSIDEIDNLNTAKRILRKPPEPSGYHAFEKEEWDVLQKVVLWIAPETNQYHLAPRIKKYLSGVLEKLPEPTPAPSANGHSEAPIPEKEAANA